MGALKRVVLAGAIVIAGCSVSDRTSQRSVSLIEGPRPVMLAHFEENRLPIAPNSDGRMVGFLPGPSASGSGSTTHNALYTYAIDFHVVSSRRMGELVSGYGVRRIYYHPDGARASFADPATFAHGPAVELDRIRFTAERPSDTRSVASVNRLVLTMRITERISQPQANPVPEPPSSEPTMLVGEFRTDLGGWLMTADPWQI